MARPIRTQIPAKAVPPRRGAPKRREGGWRKEVERVLITEGQIARRIRVMAREIERDFRGREMVVVSLLNGTVMFLADLIRHLNLPLRLDFIGVSSYGLGTESGDLVFTKELRLDVRGRDVLLVDDILDTGKTMSRVLPKIQALKPRRIKICVLLDKPSRRTKSTSRRIMSALKSRTFSWSATDWISRNGIGTCRSSACCIRTFINKSAGVSGRK